jgi:ceramide glucosyltransferase
MGAALGVYCLIYAVGALFSAKAGARALRYARGRAARETATPVTLIKPVKGVSEHSRECFESWLKQEYAGPVQFIFSLQDASDPALSLLSELRARYSFETIVNPVEPGLNGKASNLFHGVARAQHETLVFSDADITAPAETLNKIVSTLEQTPGIVSCLVRHVKTEGIWSRLYARAWNTVLFCIWAPEVLKGKPDGASGGTLAMTRATLLAVGGIEAWGRYLGEDIQLGRLAEKRGFSVVLGPEVLSPVGRMSALDLWQKFMRSNLILMHMARGGMVAVLGFFAFLFGYWGVAAGAIWSREQELFFCSVLILMLVRTAHGSWLDRLAQVRGFRALEFLVGDLMFLASAGVAIFRKRVVWSGVSYRIGRGGLVG